MGERVRERRPKITLLLIKKDFYYENIHPKLYSQFAAKQHGC
jgi:hypothetical protein